MKVFFAGFFALMILALPAKAAPDFPALTGRVVDGANILSPATEQALDAKLAGLEKSNSRQLVVVTLPSLGGYEISDYGYQLGRAWGIGQAKLAEFARLTDPVRMHALRAIKMALDPQAIMNPGKLVPLASGDEAQ